MNERIAICPGSFDPVTMGHLDIIRRASVLFDKVIVLVVVNPVKNTSFTPEERVELIRKSVEGIPNVEVDLSKVIPMVLAHDLVEIDAGDTYAYDEKGATTKEYREKQAAERIYGLLPEDQGQWLKALWEEFEAYETPEAKFAHVLDNCQPLFLNDASNGKSWEEHQVKKSQIYKRNRKTGEGSEVIWEYMKELVDKHIALGHVIDDEKDGR